jgi:predicted nuclease with TOPRIM domain
MADDERYKFHFENDDRENVGNRLNDLESRLDTVEQGVDKVDELESRLGTVEQGIDRLDVLDDLESRLDEVEKSEASGDSRLGAIYSLGATLAAILSWHSFHAVLWALLAGLLSWLYVIYYLVVNWSDVKLI